MPVMSAAAKKRTDRVEALAAEIRSHCRRHADPDKAGKWARYFKEGYDAWGLLDKDDPIWNEQGDAWAERYESIGLRGFLKLGELLFPSGKYEEGSLAIHFLKRRREEMDGMSIQKLSRWFQAGIGNWAHTDVLCGSIIEPMLLDGQIELEELATWRESSFKYQRRAVPVAMAGLAKAGRDAVGMLEFIRPLMMDEERVVGQGLGWFLRECWKKEPKPVEAFLLEYKDDAQRVIFQYATEKMPKEERARFRKSKKR